MNQAPNFFITKQADIVSGIGDRLSGLWNSIKGVGTIMTGGNKPTETSAPVADFIENRNTQVAGSNALNFFLGSALLGGGVAGVGALARRARMQSKEEELKKIRAQTAPILQLESMKRAEDLRPDRVPDPGSSEDVSWAGPATVVATAGGGLLGYLLLRNILAKEEEEKLKKERARAESSFTRSVSHALKPQGLRLRAKRASIDDLTNEEVAMIALDEYATQKVAEMKKQGSIWGKIGWWSLLPLTAAAGLGGTLGWNISSVKNPYKRELGQIKDRRLLQAINAPQAPILTIAKSRKKERKDKEDEENGITTITNE